MKRLLVLLACLFSVGQSWAQDEKTHDEDDGEQKRVTPQFRIPTGIGNRLVGANILLANVQIQDGSDAYLNIGLSPKAGFFILPNLAIGASLDFSFAGTPSGDYRVSYGITPLARVYFAHNNTARSKPLQFFIEGGAGFASINYHTKVGSRSSDETTTGGRFYVMPGIDYFLNNHVALEAGLEYLYITGTPNTQIIGLNLGFQVFLGN
jgi:hypothetical protein